MPIFRIIKRIIICGIFVTAVISASGLFAAELRLPLPPGTVKVGEKRSNLGPVKLSIGIYKTSLSEDEIYNFYEEKLSGTEWNIRKRGVFSKDKHLVTIKAYPEVDGDNKTKFNITIGNIPSKDEFLAMRKAKPDRLGFMPVYPNCTQVFHLKMISGESAAYETMDDIKEVVFFYESAMLRYGWSLARRTPLTGVDKRIFLLFRRRNGEICKIDIKDVSDIRMGFSKKVNSFGKKIIDLSARTSISVNYNANKKINP
jgi:hypothetical protein